jgi:hypothetical protein
MLPQQLAYQDPAGTATVARPRRAVWLAWILLGPTFLLLASCLVIAFTGGETWNAKLATAPVALAFAVVGALIAARTGNRLGWLFLAAGTVASLSLVMEAYAARVPAAVLPGTAWVGWSFVVVLGVEGLLFFLTLLLFPEGRPPSRWWWPVAWLAIIGELGQVVCAALSDVGFSSNFPGCGTR